jgi:DNA repair exonuclease SbcCD ATPase subunit
MKETPEEITNKMQEIAGNPVSHREQKLVVDNANLRKQLEEARQAVLREGMERDKLQALLDEILDTPIGRLITRAEELMALNEQLRNGTALQNMQAQLNSALMECEQLQERIADYDSQFSQIAQALGGDARHAKGENKTMAAFVIETVEERTEAARWLYCHPTANLASDGTALVQLHPWLMEEE